MDAYAAIPRILCFLVAFLVLLLLFRVGCTIRKLSQYGPQKRPGAGHCRRYQDLEGGTATEGGGARDRDMVIFAGAAGLMGAAAAFTALDGGDGGQNIGGATDGDGGNGGGGGGGD